jgi:hypothetical protein
MLVPKLLVPLYSIAFGKSYRSYRTLSTLMYPCPAARLVLAVAPQPDGNHPRGKSLIQCSRASFNDSSEV